MNTPSHPSTTSARPTTARRRGRHKALGVTLGLVATLSSAACASGKSILDAGNDPVPLPTIPAPPSQSGGWAEPRAKAPASTADPSLCPTEALEAADGPVEILFWSPLEQQVHVDTITALVEEYNASQDKVVVTLESQGGYDDNLAKFNQSDSGGRPMVSIHPEFAFQQLVDSGSIVPVASCIESSGYDTSPILERVAAAYSIADTQWAMAFNVSNPVLFYNKKVFEAAGLDPAAPPTNFDELREYSQAIVDSGAASFGIGFESGKDSGGGWFVEQWLGQTGDFFADGDNGRTERSTEVVFNTPASVDFLTQVQSLITDGLAVYVGENAGGIDQFLRMGDASAPSAMAIGTSAGIGPVIAALGGGIVPGLTPDDFGVGPLPGPGEGVAVGGGAVYITADKSPEEIAASWDFVQFLESAQSQSTWASATGYVPIREDALELDPLKTTYAEDPRFQVPFDQLVAVDSLPTNQFPALGPLPEIRAIVAQATGAVMQGADIAASLEAAAAQANALITQYNQLNG